MDTTFLRRTPLRNQLHERHVPKVGVRQVLQDVWRSDEAGPSPCASASASKSKSSGGQLAGAHLDLQHDCNDDCIEKDAPLDAAFGGRLIARVPIAGGHCAITGC